MKIERLSQDKIRIFLTFDDLTERGIQKDDMWREIPKVHELFSEMMDQAYTELGFDPSGPLAVNQKVPQYFSPQINKFSGYAFLKVYL